MAALVANPLETNFQFLQRTMQGDAQVDVNNRALLDAKASDKRFSSVLVAIATLVATVVHFIFFELSSVLGLITLGVGSVVIVLGIESAIAYSNFSALTSASSSRQRTEATRNLGEFINRIFDGTTPLLPYFTRTKLCEFLQIRTQNPAPWL